MAPLQRHALEIVMLLCSPVWQAHPDAGLQQGKPGGKAQLCQHPKALQALIQCILSIPRYRLRRAEHELAKDPGLHLHLKVRQ